jgi:hypothetical protein
MEEAAIDSALDASLVLRTKRPPPKELAESLSLPVMRDPTMGGTSPADIAEEVCAAPTPTPTAAAFEAPAACFIMLSMSRSSSSTRGMDDDRALGLASLIGSDPVKDEDRWAGLGTSDVEAEALRAMSMVLF